LARAAFDDLLFVAQALFGMNNLTIQVIKVRTTDIAQFDTLEIIPDALIGIEIGGITGSLFQMQAFGRPSLEKVFDLMCPMDGRSIPDEDDWPRSLA